jgi:fatty-acyl-CoA synthase
MRFSDETKGRLHDLGDITVVDLLASTEGGPYAVALTHGRADLPARLRLLPGAVVLDVQQREVQDTPGATGVLAFRGTLPQGYFNDPVKTAETFRTINGARHVVVGDWVEVLPDGYVELLGRGSSVVNTGGEKVFPVEVENALLTFPGIADAVVFGVPDPRFGEVVAATVVPDRGVELDLTAVEAHLAARLAGYKKPRRIFVRPTLQRSPHGKIDMRRLHQDAAQHMEEGIPS